MSGKLVLHIYGTTGVERECHRRRIREVERDAPPLYHSAGNIAPLDVEKSPSGYGGLETVEDLDRLVPFDGLRQLEPVSRGCFAEKIAARHKQRRNSRAPCRKEPSRPTGRRGHREVFTGACT